jgi:hypothetical protein
MNLNPDALNAWLNEHPRYREAWSLPISLLWQPWHRGLVARWAELSVLIAGVVARCRCSPRSRPPRRRW